MNKRCNGIHFILPGLLLALLTLAVARAQALPTPQSVLGHRPGDDFFLASYDESLEYFKKLADSTDKLQLVRVGQTSNGLDWYIAIISSAVNLKNLDRYKQIAKRVALVDGMTDAEARQLAQEGKAVVHIDGGLHATEVAHAQHTIQLAYKLVAGDGDPDIRRILDNVILVLWFSINPDGQNMVSKWYRRNLGTPYEVSPLPWLYQKYVGHDNNRDGYMNNMIESQVITRAAVREWFPMVFYNHHQTAPFPARIWIPPFAEPVSSNMHPLMWRWTSVFGTAMAAYLDGHGMPGAIHRGRGFDDWYPGFIDNVNNYRNTISFLTETALYRYATPHFYTVRDFPRRYQGLRKEVFYSSPWQGGWWRLGDAVHYMIGASMAVLDTAAKYKKEIIYNRYQAGRDVISQFRQEPPFAYVVPRDQRDPQTAALLVEKLRRNGIKISQATQPIQLSGRAYPAGSWIILMDQPYAQLVKELLEVQKYPDLRESEGGAPDLPYDVAGWSLPLQMGVEVVSVMKRLTDDQRKGIVGIEKVSPATGSVAGNGSTFVFDHDSNQSIRAVNRILKGGGRIGLAKNAFDAGGKQFEAGAFVATGVGRDAMGDMAADLSLQVQAVGRVKPSTVKMTSPRIGVYSSWVASIDEGWTRWLLEQYEFDFTRLYNDGVRAGHLREQFDVLIIAQMSASAIMEGRGIGTIPGEFVGGIGEQGLTHLRKFVRDGGTLITLGNASLFAIDQFNLPVKNSLQDLKNSEFFCGGSILRTEIKSSGHPIIQGLASEPAVFFARNGAFQTEDGFRGSVLLGYPKKDNPLLSGYILHPEKIQGRIAALDVWYGQGHIVLSGFRPQWRGQTHGMYKFLFNSLYYFGDAAESADQGRSAEPTDSEQEWATVKKGINKDFKEAFEKNQTFAGARGSRAVAEGKRFDDIVGRFQGTHFSRLEQMEKSAETSLLRRKLGEYRRQLKAALVDMRGKDYSIAGYTLDDLKAQFRLTDLEKEIAELIH